MDSVIKEERLAEVMGKYDRPDLEKLNEYATEFRRYYLPDQDSDSPFKKNGWQHIHHGIQENIKMFEHIKIIR